MTHYADKLYNKSIVMKKIIISRTDNIGDVVLTLPMAGAIKSEIPDSQIVFLGRDYVRPVLESSTFIDDFLSADELFALSPSAQKEKLRLLNADAIIHVFPNKQIAVMAKKAKIVTRIGTSHRPYHWLTCNQMISLGRRNSDLHEAQLNLKLLAPLGLRTEYSLKEISALYGLSKVPVLSEKVRQFLSADKKNVIIHPTSKGSAREWGLDNFSVLIKEMSGNSNIIVTGSAEDAIMLKDFIKENGDFVKNAAGKITLSELIGLIAGADILIAASTGPLHIGAALGKKVLGIYAPMRPIHPGRWSPIGENAEFLVVDKICNDCRNSNICQCIRDISPRMINEKITKMLSE